MSKEALISVLIPTYNHEMYVRESLQSVVNQTYKNIELILIDDGSKDSTWAKIKEIEPELSERFTRVVLQKSESNCGLCKTMNKLISLAKGEYILSMASDDFLLPETVNKLYTFLSANPDYVFAVGDNETVNSSSERVGWDASRNNVPLAEAKWKTFGEWLRFSRPDVDFLSEDFGSYKSLLVGNYIPNGAMIKKSTIDEIGGYDEDAPLEDWYMNFQLSKKGKFKYFDEVMCAYRWHSANTVKQSEKLGQMTKKTKKYEYSLLKKSKDENSKHYLKIYRKYLRDKLKAKIRRELKMAILKFFRLSVKLLPCSEYKEKMNTKIKQKMAELKK